MELANRSVMLHIRQLVYDCMLQTKLIDIEFLHVSPMISNYVNHYIMDTILILMECFSLESLPVRWVSDEIGFYIQSRH